MNLHPITKVQRLALAMLSSADSPLCYMPGVGQPTLDDLVEIGLIEDSGFLRNGQMIYRLTDLGGRACSSLRGRGLFP